MRLPKRVAQLISYRNRHARRKESSMDEAATQSAGDLATLSKCVCVRVLRPVETVRGDAPIILGESREHHYANAEDIIKSSSPEHRGGRRLVPVSTTGAFTPARRDIPPFSPFSDTPSGLSEDNPCGIGPEATILLLL